MIFLRVWEITGQKYRMCDLHHHKSGPWMIGGSTFCGSSGCWRSFGVISWSSLDPFPWFGDPWTLANKAGDSFGSGWFPSAFSSVFSSEITTWSSPSCFCCWAACCCWVACCCCVALFCSALCCATISLIVLIPALAYSWRSRSSDWTSENKF